MSDEFIRRSHSIGNNVHHIEWCTKYRYRMLAKPAIRESLKEILSRAAVYYHIKIIELAVMPDHVHLVVQLHPTMPQSKAVQLLKGFSAYEMFRRHPNMRKRYPRGHLWSRGNFKDSVGRNTEDRVREYVRKQEEQMRLEDFSYSGNRGL